MFCGPRSRGAHRRLGISSREATARPHLKLDVDVDAMSEQERREEPLVLRRALAVIPPERADQVIQQPAAAGAGCAPASACVILDIHMRGPSGPDVEPRMRAQDIRVPIVLFTARDDSALDRSAAASGAVCTKPLSTDTLLAAARWALGESARAASRLAE
jgi:FixJ family two-component response regulator